MGQAKSWFKREARWTVIIHSVLPLALVLLLLLVFLIRLL
jgi:hypothetical protein